MTWYPWLIAIVLKLLALAAVLWIAIEIWAALVARTVRAWDMTAVFWEVARRRRRMARANDDFTRKAER